MPLEELSDLGLFEYFLQQSFIFNEDGHARIQEFSSGEGVKVNLTKKAQTRCFIVFFSAQLILQKSNG